MTKWFPWSLLYVKFFWTWACSFFSCFLLKQKPKQAEHHRLCKRLSLWRLTESLHLPGRTTAAGSNPDTVGHTPLIHVWKSDEDRDGAVTSRPSQFPPSPPTTHFVLHVLWGFTPRWTPRHPPPHQNWRCVSISLENTFTIHHFFSFPLFGSHPFFFFITANAAEMKIEGRKPAWNQYGTLTKLTAVAPWQKADAATLSWQQGGMRGGPTAYSAQEELGGQTESQVCNKPHTLQK